MKRTLNALSYPVFLLAGLALCVAISLYLTSSMHQKSRELRNEVNCEDEVPFQDSAGKVIQFPLIIQNDKIRTLAVCRTGDLKFTASHVDSVVEIFIIKNDMKKEFIQVGQLKNIPVSRGDQLIILGNDSQKDLKYREIRVGKFKNSIALCNPVKPDVPSETGGVYNPYTGVATAIFGHPIVVPSCRGGDVTFEISGLSAGGAFPHVEIRQGKLRQRVATSGIPQNIKRSGLGGSIEIYLLNPYRSNHDQQPLAISAISIDERHHD